MRGLFRAIIKKVSDGNINMKETIGSAEMKLSDELRKPAEEEIRSGVRYAVVPLFAGVISA